MLTQARRKWAWYDHIPPAFRRQTRSFGGGGFAPVVLIILLGPGPIALREFRKNYVRSIVHKNRKENSDLKKFTAMFSDRTLVEADSGTVTTARSSAAVEVDNCGD